jgi:ribokinase
MMDEREDSLAEEARRQETAGKPRVLVVGSINMDLVIRVASIPQPGQTIAGRSFSTLPGGKGANQAVAAARCGGQVSMIGRVGNDDFGQRLLVGLKGYGVNVAGIMVSEGVSTGVATITVDDKGENAICIAGGANLLVSREDIEERAALIAQADIIVMQLEIPQETVCYTIEKAHQHQVPVILNPAPAPERIHPLLYQADVLIPNQDETALLCGEPVNDIHGAKLAGSALIRRGARTVVVTMGRRGALAITEEQIVHVPPFNAKVVDTTGAGDAFCGAFAVAYAKEKDLYQATRFAAAAGALACHKFGAQPSMPHLDTVLRLMQRNC